LSLLFVIQLLKLFHKPSIEAFALAWALAFSAVMFKESGFVTLGMYFIMAILLKRSPFSGKFRLYTAIFVTTFLAYLIFYALTRTYADKQLDLGAGAIVNLWYFTAYMFIPTAKRIVDILPSSAALILRMAKIFMVFSIPILTFYIIKRGSLAVRFFLAWVVLQISTIAIMKWDGGLFSIYPSDSAARYFQTADIGCAVILAWIITSLYRRLSQTIFSRKFSLVFLAAVFILVNFGLSNLAIKKYSERQADSAILIHGLRPISNALSNGDTLIILTNKKNIPPMSIVESDMLLEAMIFMEFDKSLKVNVNEKPGYSTSDLSIIGRKKILGWDAAGRCLIFPSEN
jgi:hypothetical protein